MYTRNNKPWMMSLMGIFMLFLLLTEQVSANVGVPIVFGGYGEHRPLYTLLLTILVAVIERPFITKAGIKSKWKALLYSLVVNAITSAIGYKVFFGMNQVNIIFFTKGGGFIIVVAILSFIISSLVEYGLLWSVKENRLKFLWIVFGNAVSLLAINIFYFVSILYVS